MSTDKKRPTSEEVVTALLESFKENAPSNDVHEEGTHASSMFLNDKPLGPTEMQDFSVLETPDDMAAVTSILVSCLATIVGSTFTGFARSIKEDMYPQLAKQLKKSGHVTDEHIKFVKTLIDQPLREMIKQDDKSIQKGGRAKLPFDIEDLLVNVLAFGMAMHNLGKLNGTLKFETGMKHAMFKLLNNSLKSAGVEPHQGTLDETLTIYIDKAVSATKKLYEEKNARTEAGDQKPRVPKDGQ